MLLRQRLSLSQREPARAMPELHRRRKPAKDKASMVWILAVVYPLLCAPGGERAAAALPAGGAAGGDHPQPERAAARGHSPGAETGCPLSAEEMVIYNRMAYEPRARRDAWAASGRPGMSDVMGMVAIL